jgi:endo-1,4-beta-xylanase
MSKMLSKSLLASFLAPLLVAAQLNELAQKAGKLYFGTATDNGELSNTTYLSILSNTSQFGQLTPGNGMKVLPPSFPFSHSHSTFCSRGEERM